MSDPLLDSLRAALSTNPENLDLRIALVRHLLDKHLAAEAEAVARQGLQLEKAPALMLLLASSFYAQGRYSEALVAAEQVRDAQPREAQAWLLMARCYFQQEEHSSATAAYREAKRLDPELHDERLEPIGSGGGGLTLPDPGARSQRPEGNASDADDAEGPDDTDGTGSETGEPESFEDAMARMEEAIEMGVLRGDPDAEYSPLRETSKIRFADVGGMEAVKEEIRMKVLHPLQHAEMFAAYGKKVGGGILMYGPPGCGKTLLARATAGEVDVPFYSIAISDIMDPYIGRSERNLRDVFAEARRNAPAVLFFDEVDALAASRRDLQQSAGRHAINQFLLELDGDQHDNEGLLIIGATNAPWYLDPAFRRPGRFDRILFVPPPDDEARQAILRVMLSKIPAADVDVAAVAKKTKDYSGADLKNLVDHCVEDILAAAMKSGRPEPIATRDLLKAIKKSRPSTKEWFVQARNHAVYANEGGLYDDVLSWLGIKK
jgi:transitional endoplasmic reticulum ATPase